MKKLIVNMATIALSSLITIPAIADPAPFTPFLTISDAQKFCPATTNLIFTPANPTPTSAGTISGIENGVKFANENPNPASQPKNKDGSGNILGVQFHDSDGMYGYLSGNAITCLYSYPGFTNGTVMLTMRGIS